MATVFGIDLGTTYSCVARCDDQHNPSTIQPKNAVSGGVIIPSVVYYEAESGIPIVGNSAKNRLGAPDSGKRILSFVKRYMGEDNYPDPILIQNAEVTLSPIEGSACILHHLIASANEEEKGHGGTPTQKAVITIPASFNNKQRESTKKAAELAGINVLGLVHEPTAAAISYGIKSGETILVFDLGGGTLDVSIVTNNRGKYTVLAAAGDKDILKRHLGGKDWDDRLMSYIVEKHGYVFGQIPNLDEKSERWTMRNRIEECKMDLSFNTKVSLSFPDWTSEEITRVEFERITDDLVLDCLKVVEKALEMADNSSKDGKANIDRCVLAGGSSNMPMIKNNLSRYLAGRVANGRNEADWLPVAKPDIAIAMGAAIYAKMLEEGTAQDDGVLNSIEEKSSHSYGTSYCKRGRDDGKIEDIRYLKNLILSTDPMVFKSSAIPFKVSEDGKKRIPIDLYENSSTDSDFPLDDTNSQRYNISKIFDEYLKFQEDDIVTKDTEVTFTARRNENGIIEITVGYLGKESAPFTIQTISPILSKEGEQHILHSIGLMDTLPEECK